MSFELMFGIGVASIFAITFLLMKFLIGPKVVEPTADYIADKIEILVNKIGEKYFG